MEQFGDAKEFPYAATSYRLTEHFHFWTKHVAGQRRAAAGVLRRDRRGAGQGEGHRERRLGARVVEARVGEGQGGRHQAHQAADRATARPVHVVGIPLHWGFMGAARKGFGPNSLTPYVGDANIETPEYKAFLVNIEPIPGRWHREATMASFNPFFPPPTDQRHADVRRAGPIRRSASNMPPPARQLTRWPS